MLCEDQEIYGLRKHGKFSISDNEKKFIKKLLKSSPPLSYK